MWRICSDNGWFSTFCKKKRGKKGKTGPPAHDDLVNRQFTATGPNDLWLAHITEHGTDEGMLYLCAIKDVWSNRIVGYSISDRIKSSTAVAALDSGRPSRFPARLHSALGPRSQFRSRDAPAGAALDGAFAVSRRCLTQWWTFAVLRRYKWGPANIDANDV